MICVIYVDNTIFTGPSPKDIDIKVKLFEIKQDS